MAEVTETPEAWTTPDFVAYETAFEVTAYAARLEK
ncbi:pyrroloquinoline quinone precursor peptide PqqA [Streptomyces sp. ISL-44]|nr:MULTISPECIES: pyrroloquinoline quinone precursor peptide PqqA [unclassified Streptomyces]MBT2543603.1 pyrroloquinoline quinone precursor peptide PqqA [Streptomyces sp. ISL-44]MCX5010961.1 pyrroloquinoline quinone precursor peptide PqqA [Streptomyces sp. NBC_00555]MCX5611451.1 pyrroloquinoline quinone precursor peptide PqqA [Streptomyces sp. NBC_00047]UUU39303.1 pyrroloquinoline quinone precursor peptide PqqA [Streptomyces sp. NBC_00162]